MHIYFSGVGGVGLGPLAEIALDAGYAVSGSDETASLMFEEIDKRGAHIHLRQDQEAIEKIHKQQPIDWFVHTAALPDDHPELVFAQENGIKISKRDELLAHIIKDKDLRLIAVAGTHGKTTTTAMVVWLLKKLNIPVSYSIGSQVSFGPSGAYDPASQYFIYECDEFDRNFLYFHPYLSLITSQDFDHSDTYASKEDYDDAFAQFKEQSQTVLLWTEVLMQPLKLAGLHNRSNGSLAIAGVKELVDEPDEKLVELLNNFPGTARRFEKLADHLYSDYAHHPTEIAATLQLSRELSKNVVVVYQPHQNIRQYEIRKEYTYCFEGAQKIYWLPTYLSRENETLAVLSPEELTQEISNIPVTLSQLDGTLWHAIDQERHDGALVVLMGAGSIDAWARQQLQK